LNWSPIICRRLWIRRQIAPKESTITTGNSRELLNILCYLWVPIADPGRIHIDNNIQRRPRPFDDFFQTFLDENKNSQ